MTEFNPNLFVDRERKFRYFQKLLESETAYQIMLIEAPEKMGKTWLIERMQHHCQEANLPVARVDFRDPLDSTRITDFLGLVRLVRDKLGHEAIFSQLNATINRLASSGAAGVAGVAPGLAKLAEKIQDHFNLAGIRMLSGFLGVNYENLPGEILFDKAYGLVRYFEQRDDLATLVNRLQSERPAANVDWWEGLEVQPAQATPAGAGEPVPASGFIADNGTAIRSATSEERLYVERQINEAFFRCLRQLIADRGKVVFLFDSYERATEESRVWLLQQLLVQLAESLNDAIVILSGRKTPDLSESAARPLVVPRPDVAGDFSQVLEPFTVEYVAEYMQLRHVQENPPAFTWPGVHLLSGGIPGVLAMMADNALPRTLANDPFFAD